MQARFERILSRSFAKSGELLARFGLTRRSFRRHVLWLPSALLVGGAVWVLLPPTDGHAVKADSVQADSVQADLVQADLPHLQLAALQSESPTAAPTNGAVAAAAPSAAAAELDRLRISSQTWRRGGLGSKALVTFTLRNDNDYAVKDVEILCAFSRRDGSHLTDRRRVLPDSVNMKSRKTFARVPVGFVNVNAMQAKCSLAAAQRG